MLKMRALSRLIPRSQVARVVALVVLIVVAVLVVRFVVNLVLDKDNERKEGLTWCRSGKVCNNAALRKAGRPCANRNGDKCCNAQTKQCRKNPSAKKSSGGGGGNNSGNNSANNSGKNSGGGGGGGGGGGKTIISRYSGSSIALGNYASQIKSWGGPNVSGVWTISGARKAFPGDKMAAVHENHQHLVGKKLRVTNSKGVSHDFRIVNICDKSDGPCIQNLKFHGFIVDVYQPDLPGGFLQGGDWEGNGSYQVL